MCHCFCEVFHDTFNKTVTLFMSWPAYCVLTSSYSSVLILVYPKGLIMRASRDRWLDGYIHTCIHSYIRRKTGTKGACCNGAFLCIRLNCSLSVKGNTKHICASTPDMRTLSADRNECFLCKNIYIS